MARSETGDPRCHTELLAESGVQGLTMEGVAARAGVAKTTVYRRWRSKDDLALAVVIDMVENVVATPDLGDTRKELVSFVNAAVTILGSTLMGRVMQGLVSDLATDPELARAFQERVVSMRVAEVRRLIERGIERATYGRTPTSSSPTSCCSAPSTTGSCSAAPRSTASSPGVSSTQYAGDRRAAEAEALASARRTSAGGRGSRRGSRRCRSRPSPALASAWTTCSTMCG